MSEPAATPPPSALRARGIAKALGPGLIVAAAAIGGSHVVQSTQAGAIYGFALVWAVILVNIFKYPFFEYCFRYKAAMGTSIMEGYRDGGTWMLLTVQSVVVIVGAVSYAGVSFVTGALATLIFPESIPLPGMWVIPMGAVEYTVVVNLVCLALLLVGRYPLLDRLIKGMMVILSVTTVLAVAVAIANGSQAQPDFARPEMMTAVGITFLLALMGWMPAPIDVAIWGSLYGEERDRQTGYRPTLKESLADFQIGYVGTSVLALFFLALGALVIYGTGVELERGAAGFSRQLVSLYTTSLGEWTYWIVSIAVFLTMFSTTLTCLDGFPRTLHRGFKLLFRKEESKYRKDGLYWGLHVVFVVISVVVAYRFATSLVGLILVATTVSYLTAPVMAWINHRVVTTQLPEEFRPPRWLRWLAVAGFIFLSAFVVLFVVARLTF